MKPRLPFLLCFCLALLACAAMPAAAAPLDAFYDPPAPLPPGAPGEIIRAEKLPPSTGVSEWRVMFHSTDLSGHDAAVTGVFAVPAGPPPAGGFPVIALAHPTVGLARKCAPSVAAATGGVAALYSIFLKAGFAVTAPDYQGLGAPGEPSYLIGPVEAHNLLDAARAIARLPGAQVSGQALIWGYSQGGHAAAFAAETARDYAPDLHLTGIVIVAPGARLDLILDNVFAHPQPGGLSGIVALIVVAWGGAYKIPPTAILTPAGQKLMPTVIGQCASDVVAAFNAEPPAAYFKSNPVSTPPWSGLVRLNLPRAVKYAAPVMIVQGYADSIAIPAATEAFAADLCRAGNAVELREYPGADHGTIVGASTGAVLAWMRARLAGEPPPSTCR